MSVSKSAREKMQGSVVFGAIKMLFYLEKLIILVPNIKNINIKNTCSIWLTLKTPYLSDRRCDIVLLLIVSFLLI